MDNLIKTFTTASKDLSKNPLGIIALFIVLVYSIAGLVFGLSGAHLSDMQKWPLVWFLALFPVLVLVLFGWLVAKHHTKLYSPRDYFTEEGFFHALSPEQRTRKIEEDAKEVLTRTSDRPQDERNSSFLAQDILLADVRSRYIIAEELVFRELEEQYTRPIQRNIGISGDYGFDGLLVRGRRFTAFEVKFTRQGHWCTSILRKVFPTFKRLSNDFPKYSDFVLVIVYEGIDEGEVKRNRIEAEAYLRECEVRIQLKVFDFDQLRVKYGLAETKVEHGAAQDGESAGAPSPPVS